MSKYTFVKKTVPDWDKKASADLKTSIKAYILYSVLGKKPREKIFEKVDREISVFVGEFDETEREVANGYRDELTQFSSEAYDMTKKAVEGMTAYMFAMSLAPPETLTDAQKKVIAEARMKSDISQGTAPPSQSPENAPGSAKRRVHGYRRGTAADTYYDNVHRQTRDFMRDFEEYAKPRQYIANVNPRSIAEAAVRFDKYRQEKHRLIEDGVTLVYVPPHANCSKRCQPFQGRIYSLDGTEGQRDGRRYVPIEKVAEGVTYTSKRTGRTYAAGLFSYNCRHTMVPYKDGQNVEVIPDHVIDRERAIEAEQRRIEREVRLLKEKRLLYKQIDKQAPTPYVEKKIKELNKQAIQKAKEYREFSRKNNVPIYEERLRILTEYDETTGKAKGENIYLRTLGRKDPVVKNIKI